MCISLIAWVEPSKDANHDMVCLEDLCEQSKQSLSRLYHHPHHDYLHYPILKIPDIHQRMRVWVTVSALPQGTQQIWLLVHQSCLFPFKLENRVRTDWDISCRAVVGRCRSGQRDVYRCGLWLPTKPGGVCSWQTKSPGQRELLSFRETAPKQMKGRNVPYFLSLFPRPGEQNPLDYPGVS